jgi:hypothetical protein
MPPTNRLRKAHFSSSQILQMTSQMALPLYKAVLPNRPLPLPILRGPFRGATIQLNPRHSLRKVFGLYERELNDWLERVLPRVSTVIDVGANDGYFTFGCAAAFRRLGKVGEVISFEPEAQAFKQLRSSLASQRSEAVQISLHEQSVGAETCTTTITLNAFAQQKGTQRLPENALIKMDVEGAELEVIAGASLWLNSTNYFLIEVHAEPFLESLITTFSGRGMKLRRINQRPLPIFGYENRSRQNWWLVSELLN